MNVLTENDIPMCEQEPINCNPIFILGVMPRSGTNFLYNLLCLHTHCEGVGIRDMPEDSLLYNADLLARYVSNVSSFWNRHGLRGKDDPERQQYNLELGETLFKSLGKGLLSYLDHLNQNSGKKPLVTKTPFVRNLRYFYQLFPNARLIILVRDGRAVAESNYISFGMSYEVGIHRWTAAAQEIIEFDKQYRHSDYQYLIVKYEDIVRDLETQMKRILAFLELDPKAYDFETALNLPVFGSSEEFAKARAANVDDPGEVGWKIIERRKKKFDPTSRWKHWSPMLNRRFQWIASSDMESLGYEISDLYKGSFFNTALNTLLDWKWKAITTLMQKGQDIERLLHALYLVRRRYKELRMEEKSNSYWLG
ncbi:MAG: sulfotransferase [Leptolyngbyaceae bacterium]|nr:sulfotransferase [Leptolyngbyaceae bacterium]